MEKIDLKKEARPAIAIAVVLVVIGALWMAVFSTSGPQAVLRLQLAVGYGLAVLLFLFGFVILIGMATGHINIDTILSESGGGASMSRFQLLIFTFVIALSLFFIVANNPKQFPPVPADILTLLGISATTYGVSKGIQAANPDLKPKDSGGSGAIIATTTTQTTTTQTTPPAPSAPTTPPTTQTTTTQATPTSDVVTTVTQQTT
jgi:hypothetical protein